MSQDRFLPPKKVAELTSFHRTTLYRKAKAGTFPSPVKIGERRIAYREREVLAWMEAREALEVSA